MQNFTTPMMKQYVEIKKNYEDCLLFYRMGDFYELFLEDAIIGSQILNITLTSRAKGKDGRIPMAGVPYHAVDVYLSKLVKSGHKVAICEQMTLPNKKGIIHREVVRIITPGTVLDEKSLEKKENNYIISLLFLKETFALTVADISTGYLSTMERTGENIYAILKDELSRIHPKECILPNELYNNAELLQILKTEKDLNIYPFADWERFAQKKEQVLKEQFSVSTLASFGIEDKSLSIESAAALLGYLKHTQKTNLSHIKKITLLEDEEYMLLDRSTILNLELFTTIREHDTRGSLLTVLDETHTAMGGRKLKQWLIKPLLKKERIESRFDAVSELLEKRSERENLRNLLKHVPDIERILSRLSVNLGNSRDLVHLKSALTTIQSIKKELRIFTSKEIQLLNKKIKTELSLVIERIENSIVDEPPIHLKEGGIFKSGVDSSLDEMRKIVGGKKEWIIDLEKKERVRTGIASLKIRFNNIFGFYIEISKSNLHLIPDNYIRKQTLVNGERYITPELKVEEEIILRTQEKINALEYELFTKLLSDCLSHISLLLDAADSIGSLDCLCSFAHLSEKRRYIRPKLLYSGEVKITNGRHPVVETLLDERQFVPNDVTLDTVSQQLLLITGPNMAGKSVFIRQVALLVLMSQIGCFVPADKAYISLVDRIFVRSGASDVITSGLSTFMVEMVETAHILHYATSHSLIIMDEIGRGTSTYDGISIAWAVAEYLVTHHKQPPKTLFATHYHELQDLENQYPTHIKNFHMAVTEEKGEPIFLHTILPGGASHSFGVAVAKLAGIPESVIENAKKILKELEKRHVQDVPTKIKTIPYTLNASPLVEHILEKELSKLDISQLTPLQALNVLASLKDKLKLYHEQDTSFSTSD